MKFISSLLLLGAVALTISSTFAREQQETQQQKQKQSALRRPNTNTNPNNNSRHHSFETREVEPGVFSISVTTPDDYDYNYEDTDDTTRRRRRAQVSRQLVQGSQSCTLHLEDVYYHAEDIKNVEEKWVCTFENYIRTSEDEDGLAYPHSFEILGSVKENRRRFNKAGAVSGKSILRWKSSEKAITINEVDNKLDVNWSVDVDVGGAWIDINEPVESDEISSRNRKLGVVSSTGSKKTLVIRVVGNRVAPRASISQLKEDIFGSGNSLKTQMGTCSHNKLTIEPYTGPTNGVFDQNIQGGVIEIGITSNPYGKTDKEMENDAMQAAYYVFGDLAAQFDLVLFAMPPGISPGFAAYAYIGSPFSYYSNESIEDVMVQMHEVGHNLGLQHAGEGRVEDGEEYGDPSGYMGYSTVLDPKMCYNAANNYQLGWYSQFSIKPTSVDGYGGTFYISGVAGYDPNDTSKFVSLRLEQESLTADYYVGYNWASGMNAETQEDADKVIIVEKNGAVHASEVSWKKAALSVGESYVIENYDNSGKYVTVIFSNIIDGNVAIVDILPEFVTLSPSASPTASPSNEPSASPTVSPSVSPSASPSVSPSVSPSASPSAFNETDMFYYDDQFNNETDNNETGFMYYDDMFSNETDNNETGFMYYDDMFSNETDNNETYFDDMYSNETDSNETDIEDLDDGFNNDTSFPTTWYPTEWESTWNPTSEDSCEDQALELLINIRTDNHPEEISWNLKVQQSKIISQVEKGTYQNRNSVYTDNFCLEYDTCYHFKIKDQGGDGMLGGTNRVGFYEVYLDDQLIVREEGDWGRKKSHRFCTDEAPTIQIVDNAMISEISNIVINDVPAF